MVRCLEEAVDVGLLALVFEVLDAAHALDDEVGVQMACQVDGEAFVCHHFHAGVVGVDAGDGFDALLRVAFVFLFVVHPDGDDEAVGDEQCSPCDVVVTDGEGVETPWEDCCCFHSKRSRCWGVLR